MSTSKRTFLCSLIGIALLLGFSAGAVGQATGPSDPPLDPIVAQVVEMLNAGVSDSLILQWLDTTDRRPADIGSHGLIALTEAEASEQLTSTLLELAGQEREGESALEPRPGLTPSEADTGVSPPSPTSTHSGGDSGVDAIVRLSAKQVWVDEDEPDSPREPRWNVFLYLDGELVVWVRPDTKGKPVEARTSMQPGRRELRVVLQRYEERRGGWLYESLSVPSLVHFEVEPGDPVEIEVDMKRIWGLWRDRKEGGPMSYVVRQGNEILIERGGTGGNPDRWEPVCEDVEANFPEAQEVPRAFRRAMNRCVRWSDLWNGTGQSTSRPEILRALADYDFEPPIR
jgi:hypothetical protein